ncbi:MAG: nucleoside deaminase [Pirellulaceae bacterium]|nr:nucleoside deaminase [Pirellulaceae bacterium]
MLATQLHLCLPSWLCSLTSELGEFKSLGDRMRLAIDIADRNISHATGGPFGAAVFDLETNELVGVGVNMVVTSGLSIAHAEIVALSLSQQRLKTFDLSKAMLQLVTSAEPCWMCLGAIHWAGVRSVVSAARDSDVREIGFDEGHKPHDWAAEYVSKGIDVICDVERDAAVKVLRKYRHSGGHIYNAGTCRPSA